MKKTLFKTEDGVELFNLTDKIFGISTEKNSARYSKDGLTIENIYIPKDPEAKWLWFSTEEKASEYEFWRDARRKRYKLIKEFPSSPNIGTIINFMDDFGIYFDCDYYLSDNIDCWEELPSYEIMSVERITDSVIFEVGERVGLLRRQFKPIIERIYINDDNKLKIQAKIAGIECILFIESLIKLKN